MSRFIKYLFLLLIICCASDVKYPAQINSPKIILLTIDGVRWQDMFADDARKLMPTIYKTFMDQGISVGKSSPAYVSGPAHISMPGYLEIMRGHPTKDCFDNYCPQNYEPTIIDLFKNNATVISGWDTIAKTFNTDYAKVNIGYNIRNNAWRNLGINDVVFNDDFGDPEYRPDNATMEIALSYLKLEQPRFLWISLGDTDEWAHQGNRAQYYLTLTDIDRFTKKIMEIADKNTVFIICPDHGRADDFVNHHFEEASRRVFILLYGSGIKKKSFYEREVFLSDIYWTVNQIAFGEQSDKSLLGK